MARPLRGQGEGRLAQRDLGEQPRAKAIVRTAQVRTRWRHTGPMKRTTHREGDDDDEEDPPSPPTR